MRFFVLGIVLSALFLLPAAAQEPEELAARVAAPWSPRLYLMDGGGHALGHQILLRERWPSIPATIDSRWVFQPYPGVDFWAVDIAKIRGALTAFTNEAEKEQRVAAGKPRPVRVLWLGSVLLGGPDLWWKQLDRLAQTALIIVPGGNDPRTDSSEYWTSRGLKVGSAPNGQDEGATDRKKALIVYLDFGPIEVNVPGRGVMPLGLTSTASALFAGYLADALAGGAGATLSPLQIAAKLRAGFRGEDGHALVIPEDELEARIIQILGR